MAREAPLRSLGLAQTVDKIVSSGAGASDCVADVAGTVMRSAEIFARGWRALGDAAMGLTWISLEEAAVAARGLWSTPDPLRQAWRLEESLWREGAVRVVGRTALMSTMALEVVEDALFPLSRGTSRVFEGMARAAAA